MEQPAGAVVDILPVSWSVREVRVSTLSVARKAGFSMGNTIFFYERDHDLCVRGEMLLDRAIPSRTSFTAVVESNDDDKPIDTKQLF